VKEATRRPAPAGASAFARRSHAALHVQIASARSKARSPRPTRNQVIMAASRTPRGLLRSGVSSSRSTRRRRARGAACVPAWPSTSAVTSRDGAFAHRKRKSRAAPTAARARPAPTPCHVAASKVVMSEVAMAVTSSVESWEAADSDRAHSSSEFWPARAHPQVVQIGIDPAGSSIGFHRSWYETASQATIAAANLFDEMFSLRIRASCTTLAADVWMQFRGTSQAA